MPSDGIAIAGLIDYFDADHDDVIDYAGKKIGPPKTFCSAHCLLTDSLAKSWLNIDFSASIRRLQLASHVAHDSGVERGYAVATELNASMLKSNVTVENWFAASSSSSDSRDRLTSAKKEPLIGGLKKLKCWQELHFIASEVADLFRYFNVASEEEDVFSLQTIRDALIDTEHIPEAINQSVTAYNLVPGILHAVGFLSAEAEFLSSMPAIFKSLDDDQDGMVSTSDLSAWISSVCLPDSGESENIPESVQNQPQAASNSSNDMGRSIPAADALRNFTEVEDIDYNLSALAESVQSPATEDSSKRLEAQDQIEKLATYGVDDFLVYFDVCGALELDGSSRFIGENRGQSVFDRLTFQVAYRRLRSDLARGAARSSQPKHEEGAKLVRRFFMLLELVGIGPNEFASGMEASHDEAFVYFAEFRNRVQGYEKDMPTSWAPFKDDELSELLERFEVPLQASGILKAYRQALVTDVRNYGKVESSLPLRTFVRQLEGSAHLCKTSMVDVFDEICPSPSGKMTRSEMRRQLLLYMNPISISDIPIKGETPTFDAAPASSNTRSPREVGKGKDANGRDVATPELPAESVSEAALKWYASRVQQLYEDDPEEIARRKKPNETGKQQLPESATKSIRPKYVLEELMSKITDISTPTEEFEAIRRLDKQIQKKLGALQKHLAAEGPDNFVNSSDTYGDQRIDQESEEEKLYAEMRERWTTSNQVAMKQLTVVADGLRAKEHEARQLEDALQNADDLLRATVDSNESLQNYLTQLEAAKHAGTGSLLRL
jgi:hypothetical protein